MTKRSLIYTILLLFSFIAFSAHAGLVDLGTGTGIGYDGSDPSEPVAEVDEDGNLKHFGLININKSTTGISSCTPPKILSGQIPGTSLYKECICPAEYKAIDTSQYVGVGDPCDGKYKDFTCINGRTPMADGSCVCSAGEYYEASSNTCKTCEAGNKCENEIKTPCDSTAQYQPNEGQTECLLCDPGYGVTLDRINCNICSAGTASADGEECIDCLNYQCSGAGAHVCYDTTPVCLPNSNYVETLDPKDCEYTEADKVWDKRNSTDVCKGTVSGICYDVVTTCTENETCQNKGEVGQCLPDCNATTEQELRDKLVYCDLVTVMNNIDLKNDTMEIPANKTVKGVDSSVILNLYSYNHTMTLKENSRLWDLNIYAISRPMNRKVEVDSKGVTLTNTSFSGATLQILPDAQATADNISFSESAYLTVNGVFDAQSVTANTSQITADGTKAIFTATSFNQSKGNFYGKNSAQLNLATLNMSDAAIRMQTQSKLTSTDITSNNYIDISQSAIDSKNITTTSINISDKTIKSTINAETINISEGQIKFYNALASINANNITINQSSTNTPPYNSFSNVKPPIYMNESEVELNSNVSIVTSVSDNAGIYGDSSTLLSKGSFNIETSGKYGFGIEFSRGGSTTGFNNFTHQGDIYVKSQGEASTGIYIRNAEASIKGNVELITKGEESEGLYLYAADLLIDGEYLTINSEKGEGINGIFGGVSLTINSLTTINAAKTGIIVAGSLSINNDVNIVSGGWGINTSSGATSIIGNVDITAGCSTCKNITGMDLSGSSIHLDGDMSVDVMTDPALAYTNNYPGGIFLDSKSTYVKGNYVVNATGRGYDYGTNGGFYLNKGFIGFRAMDITLEGNITATVNGKNSTAIQLEAETKEIKITGNLTATTIGEKNLAGVILYSHILSAPITVNGNIKATVQGDGSGIYAAAKMGYVEFERTASDINITGDVNVASSNTYMLDGGGFTLSSCGTKKFNGNMDIKGSYFDGLSIMDCSSSSGSANVTGGSIKIDGGERGIRVYYGSVDIYNNISIINSTVAGIYSDRGTTTYYGSLSYSGSGSATSGSVIKK